MSTLGRLEKRLHNLPPQIYKLTKTIDDLKSAYVHSPKLHHLVLGRLKQFALITSTGASTRIEGSTMADADVKSFVQGLKITNYKDRDRQEVQGYYELLQTVYATWDSIPFTMGTIKQFHKELLKYSAKDAHHLGEFKVIDNTVRMVTPTGKILGTVFETTPMYLTNIEMTELVEWTQNAIKQNLHHPLLIIGNFIVEFLKIHPFTDGNGRLSRILTNFLMLKLGYPYAAYTSHERLIEEQKAEYYLALRTSQFSFKAKSKKVDVVTWLTFFLGILEKQAVLAVKAMSNEFAQNKLSTNQIAVLTYLETVQSATPKEITLATGILPKTVAQVLGVLSKLNKVQRCGRARATRYTIV